MRIKIYQVLYIQIYKLELLKLVKNPTQGKTTLLTSNIVFPISAGDNVTVTPASFRDAIFSSAPPLPPAMIAPAWPILLPGGAVSPAIKDTTGLAVGP